MPAKRSAFRAQPVRARARSNAIHHEKIYTNLQRANINFSPTFCLNRTIATITTKDIQLQRHG